MVHNENVMPVINDLIGDKDVKYIERKHRGGSSGAKGAHYEDVFLAIKVAEAAETLSCNG